MKDNKTANIIVRVEPTMKAGFQKQAKEAGLSLSSWVLLKLQGKI